MIESVPQISILVPTYNRRQLLAESLASILQQSFIDFEIIIVDNCSTDDTAEMIAMLDDVRIVYLKNSANIGPVNNHNRALRTARGKYIYFFSDDDVMLAGNLARKIRIFEQHPSVGLVHSGCNTIDGQGNVISAAHWAPAYLQQIMVSSPLMDKATAFKLLYYNWNFIAMPTVMVRADILQASRLEMNNQLKYLYDWDLWTKLALTTDFYYLEETLVAYRLHATNDTHFFTSKVLYQEMCLAKLGMLNLFDKGALHGRNYLVEVGRLVTEQLKLVSKHESYFQEKTLPLRNYLKNRFSANTVERLRKLRYLKFGN